MSLAKKILVGLVVLFIVLQFVRPSRNTNDGSMPHDISTVFPIPDSVNSMLQTACYDCHSNNTRYPWYNKIQPTTWYLAKHVDDGKRHLNFDEFASYTLKRQAHKLDEVVKEIKKGGMPLTSYNLIHTDARLSTEQKNVLINWAENLSKEIKPKDTTASPK